MNDFIEDYMDRVRKRLSRREDNPVKRMAEVLCFPSFHPEALLRVANTAAGTTFRLATFTSSLWYSEPEEAKGECPERVQEVAAVSPESAVRFWNSIDELKPEAIRPDNAIGADGMSVRASYHQGET